MGDDMTNQDTFDILEKYVDEHISEIFDILRKEYLSKFIDIRDTLIGDAVTWATYEFPDYNPIPIDNNEHMWYNKFNKWNWNKFENGVIKIENDERRI